jgi:hypothetical protein
MNFASKKYVFCSTTLFCIVNILLYFAFINFHTVNAENSPKSLPISVMPILPDNQKDGVERYFHLLFESGDIQQLNVKISNPTDQDQIVNIATANALTAQNGGIIYVSKNNSQHVGLIDQNYALKGYLQVESEVKVTARSTLNVPVTVKVPKGEAGSFLGGLLFTVKSSNTKPETNDNEGNATFSITNRFVYAMAIQLDLPKTATASFVLENANVETYPSEPKLLIHMKNESPMILRDVSGSYEVTNDEGRTLFSGKWEPFMAAPKSEIHYPIAWNYKMMEPGNYFIKLHINLNEQTIIKTQKPFEIENNSMKRYQAASVQPVLIAYGISLWTWILGGVFVIALLLIGFWLGKRINNINETINKNV